MPSHTARRQPPKEDWAEEAKRPRPPGDSVAERPCLACQKIFVSEGWHNRLCLDCRKKRGGLGGS